MYSKYETACCNFENTLQVIIAYNNHLKAAKYGVSIGYG